MKKTKTIEEQWKNLPANYSDGFYAKRGGFQHSKVYEERLQFVKNKVIEREEEIIEIIKNFKVPKKVRVISDGVDVNDEYKQEFYNRLMELIIKKIKM